MYSFCKKTTVPITQLIPDSSVLCLCLTLVPFRVAHSSSHLVPGNAVDGEYSEQRRLVWARGRSVDRCNARGLHVCCSLGGGYIRRHSVCAHGLSCRQSTTWGMTLRMRFTFAKVLREASRVTKNFDHSLTHSLTQLMHMCILRRHAVARCHQYRFRVLPLRDYWHPRTGACVAVTMIAQSSNNFYLHYSFISCVQLSLCSFAGFPLGCHLLPLHHGSLAV